MGKLTLIKVAVLLICSTRLTVPEALALPDCSSEISLLIPCVGFVSGLDPSPPQLCCDSLKSVVTAEAVCLCELLGYGGNLSIPSTFNQTRVTELPAFCKIAANPAQCIVLINGAPSSSPLPSAGSPGPVSGAPAGDSTSHGDSTKIPGTASSIWKFAAAVAVASLLLRVY